jgi:RPA family protein
MSVQRQTAIKVRIVDLVSGEFVRQEGMEPSYVVTPRKESVSRARIIGTVVSKFVSEDGNFASITVDDSTATIQGKMWKETALIAGTNVGDLVSLIGKAREYEGDIYVVPEIITPVSPDQESMLRLEALSGLGKGVEAAGAKEAPEPRKADDEQVRKKILSLIEGSKDGVKYSELLEKAQVPEEALENLINELLGEGICYEPTPGKIKKI